MSSHGSSIVPNGLSMISCLCLPWQAISVVSFTLAGSRIYYFDCKGVLNHGLCIPLQISRSMILLTLARSQIYNVACHASKIIVFVHLGKFKNHWLCMSGQHKTQILPTMTISRICDFACSGKHNSGFRLPWQFHRSMPVLPGQAKSFMCGISASSYILEFACQGTRNHLFFCFL